MATVPNGLTVVKWLGEAPWSLWGRIIGLIAPVDNEAGSAPKTEAARPL